jgi:hypothetical protein
MFDVEQIHVALDDYRGVYTCSRDVGDLPHPNSKQPRWPVGLLGVPVLAIFTDLLVSSLLSEDAAIAVGLDEA